MQNNYEKKLEGIQRHKKQPRQSNFELLRILCIWGIVTMHAYSIFYSTATGVNLVYGVFINSIFNVGVSLFILISGYFGIKCTTRRILKLEFDVMFYSILGEVVVTLLLTKEFNVIEFIKACFPVSTEKYWFITSYMLLMIFANYINRISDKLTKQDFEKLLAIMFAVFYLLPTIVQYHVMGDNGKGFANMFFLYLLGRYIKMYYDDIKISRKHIVIGFASVLGGFGLNLILTLIRGGKGVCAPFAKDSSCFILITAIIIFILFKNIEIESKIINRIAKHVIAIYLFEGTVRMVLNYFFDFMVLSDKWYLFMILFVYGLGIMIVCMFLDMLKNLVIDPIEERICLIADNCLSVRF